MLAFQLSTVVPEALASECAALEALYKPMQEECVLQACLPLSPDSSAADLHGNMSNLQAMLKGEADAWHTLHVNVLTQVGSTPHPFQLLAARSSRF